MTDRTKNDPSRSPGIWRRVRRRPGWVLGLTGFLGVVAIAVWPTSVPIDIGEVGRGPLRETVMEDGRTRLKQRYVVSAPMPGALSRIELRPGDRVVAGETVLATIEPAHPSLLDASAQAEAEARVEAGKASLQRAEAARDRAGTAMRFAGSRHARLERLFSEKVVSREEFDRAVEALRVTEADHRQAVSAVEVARFELDHARAALMRLQPDEGRPGAGRFRILPPVNGVVLRVLQESAATVTAGHPLIELGDPADLEVEIDVLSADAVRIRPGAPVRLEHWGGEEPLEARVRRVEPAAFTKVSALGVEEQRVWVIADLVDDVERRPWLGDGYRVEASIVTWEAEDVLRVPAGALFRSGGEWAVFVVNNGRARLRTVKIGRDSGREAQVIAGLKEGETVILHPGDRISDGVRVRSRAAR